MALESSTALRTRLSTFARLPLNDARVHVAQIARLGLCRLLQSVPQVRGTQICIFEVRHANILPRAHRYLRHAITSIIRSDECNLSQRKVEQDLSFLHDGTNAQSKQEAQKGKNESCLQYGAIGLEQVL